MQAVYNQTKSSLYKKRSRFGTKLAETSRKIDEQRRRQGKTLKVTALSQGNCEYVPSIRVAGKWLRQFGFELGDQIVLTAKQDEILIVRKENNSGRRTNMSFLRLNDHPFSR